MTTPSLPSITINIESAAVGSSASGTLNIISPPSSSVFTMEMGNPLAEMGNPNAQMGGTET